MIRHERHDAVALLTLDDGKVNTLDREVLEALADALGEVEAGDAGAVVLTGRGAAFSAGVDLFRVLDGGADYLAGFLPVLSGSLERLFAFPRPVVAAVNGHAIAGGAVLTAACDLRIMAAGTGRFGVPELLVGVPFPTVPLEVLRFATPPEHLQEIVYTGRTYPPEEALRLGLLDEVVEPDRLLDRSLEAARALAALPPAAFRITKENLRRPALERMRALASVLDGRVREAWSAPETSERIHAHLGRTVGRGR